MSANDTPLRIVDKRRNWEARVEMLVLRLPKSVLGAHDKLVYTVLCGHADRDCEAGVYVRTIADEASCSERQVRYSLAKLEKRGLLVRRPSYKPDGGQTFNIYEIYGIENYVPAPAAPAAAGGDAPDAPDTPPAPSDDAPAPPECGAAIPLQDIRDTPAGLAGVYIDEQLPKNINTYSPTESAKSARKVFSANARNMFGPVGASEIPEVMRPTVKYFLNETGRKNIEPSELISLRALEGKHYPTRINLEIDAAVERFRRLGRDPASLRLDYLYESLGRQPGRKPRQPRASPEEQRAREENLAWEREQQEELLRRFGGGPYEEC
jgi:hypothetical protein